MSDFNSSGANGDTKAISSDDKNNFVKCRFCDKPCEEREFGDFHCCCCGEHGGCDDCWPDHGTFCSQCKFFVCHDCDGGDKTIVYCDNCGEIYCEECGDMKPWKGGGKECHNCQPWYKKNKPASDFCSVCGGGCTGRNRRQCMICGKVVHKDCFCGISCASCDDYMCDDCSDGNFCDECCENSDPLCRECCDGHETKENGEEKQTVFNEEDVKNQVILNEFVRGSNMEVIIHSFPFLYVFLSQLITDLLSFIQRLIMIVFVAHRTIIPLQSNIGNESNPTIIVMVNATRIEGRVMVMGQYIEWKEWKVVMEWVTTTLFILI